MPVNLPIKGGCACGQVGFECRQPPAVVFQCHCKNCQRATGGPFAVNAWFDLDHVEIRGEFHAYANAADTGATATLEFCASCGSPVAMRTTSMPGAIGLRAASFDDMAWLEPMANLYMKNSPAWEWVNPDLPSFDSQPSPEEFAAFANRQN